MGENEKVDLPPRQQWGKQREFIFAIIGGAIGLGNVWRFPYLCYKNGGGVFLIPYFIFLLLGGIPIFLLEVSLGQFMQSGAITAWNLVPAFKGIGWCSFVIVFWLNSYYIIILGWDIFYLCQIFTAELPWTRCDAPWNTDCCSKEYFNGTLVKPENCTGLTTYPELEFWKRRTLEVTDGLGNPGGMRWELVATVFAAWVMSYICIFKGTKSTGKSVYITSTFPLVMLMILLIRGVTLDGAAEGIYFYLNPDFSKLAEPEVWLDAGTQVFFSYMIGIGTIISLGSYNKYNFNVWKWSAILCCFNCTASITSGFAIFSILGYMAKSTGMDIHDVAESGPGLAFIVYPKALSMLFCPQLWAGLFFLMLLMLGLASHYVAVDGICTMLVDLKPEFFHKTKSRRPLFVACTCLTHFIISLPMLTKGGIYVFQLFDKFGASGLTLLWVGFFQTVAISWIYGTDTYYENLHDMFGHKINVKNGAWRIVGYVLWKFVTPFACTVVFMYYLFSWSATTYDKTYVYPMWGEILGMCLALSSMLTIPGHFLYYYFKSSGSTFKEKWVDITTPIYNRPSIDKSELKEESISEIDGLVMT